jgi:putative transposase
MQKKSYKFRLYPTAAQQTLFEKTLELCRWTYNETLAFRKNAWEQEQKSYSKFDTHNLLPQWKEAKPELKEAHSQVLCNVQERVDLAFRAFFQRVKRGEKPGYPRFKGRGWYKSLTYPQYGNGCTLKGDTLTLSKIGAVKVVLHRRLPAEAVIKRVTIKHESDKWYAAFSVQQPDMLAKTHATGMVGIDLGCKSFVTLSDGSHIENPKFLKKATKRVKRAQRKLAKQKKGTPERSKARKVLGKVFQKVNNQRGDFLHQTSRQLVNRYKTIIFEDLKIQDMVQAKPWHALNRTILDASWDNFVFMCRYKAESAGGQVITVNPKNTTKQCSRCGALVEKDLAERTHRCPQCLLVIDRDLNAALNILRLGQQSLAKLRSA